MMDTNRNSIFSIGAGMEYGISRKSNCYPYCLHKSPSSKTKQSVENISDSGEEDTVTFVSSEFFFPEGILEKILSFLPVDSFIRASSVSHQWHEAAYLGKYKWNRTPRQNPWYFMFTCGNNRVSGFAYDPSRRKWFRYQIPCIQSSSWSISSSTGLVCTMDTDVKSQIYVCNPITKRLRKLPEAPGGEFPDYSALAVSVDRESESYRVAVVECRQEDECWWEFTVRLYESTTGEWVSALPDRLNGWRGGDECVIVGEVLYYMIYSTSVMGNLEVRHCLVMYDLSRRMSGKSLMDSAIPAPCSLTCGKLMNLKDRLVMVGGIGKRDRPGIVKGIGIWELKGREWKEVARMPHKYFRGFGEFDDVFASNGAEELIYIQSFGSPALLTFDMAVRVWRWSAKCPVTKKFPLQLFTGFCFEPRIEVTC